MFSLKIMWNPICACLIATCFCCFIGAIVDPPCRRVAQDCHLRGVRLPSQRQRGQQQMHPLPRVVLAEPATSRGISNVKGETGVMEVSWVVGVPPNHGALIGFSILYKTSIFWVPPFMENTLLAGETIIRTEQNRYNKKCLGVERLDVYTCVCIL